MKKPRRLKKGRGNRGRGRPPAHRPRLDTGTPEARARRLALARGGNPDMVSCPMDIYLTRGVITARQHEAGKRYAVLYGAFCGRTSAQSSFARSPGGGTARDEESQARLESRYRDITARLDPRDKKIVDRVCVYHGAVASTEWLSAIPRLRDALDDLADQFGLARKAAARASPAPATR